MKTRLKIVPDDDPNARGTWITMPSMSVPNKRLFEGLDLRARWDLYNAQAPAGHHVVKVCHYPDLDDDDPYNEESDA